MVVVTARSTPLLSSDPVRPHPVPPQWARSNPKLTVYTNPGWPGCCRPPNQSEYRLIQPADWPTVSIVHSIPMPPEIKSVLDAVLSRASPIPIISSARAQSQHPSSTSILDRRNSTSSPSIRPCSTPKSQPVAIPSRGRSGGSPVPQSPALGGTTPRSSAPASDQYTLSRRQTFSEGTKDRSRAPSARSILSRRFFGRTLSSKRSTLETAMATLDVSSSSEGSSDSGSSRGSLSDATVTSDGAFTDYLSDESEAELQRQAEAKAALVAQNQAEELEFKAARQQLAGVGLRPPKTWDDTNETVPRATSHASVYTHHSAYHATAYASAAVAHSARG
ncbi:hypothetical protein JVT61DRAFT_13125 [Boletus reticuloceps]|uniref:Uncharacterized protein n=2 Tax=Boletus TaxID=5369 RepID=A0A8I3ADV5_9AGAM|nr:hypothetical protein JVT61DRAFT_13125 [Boletus reticuloceps]